MTIFGLKMMVKSGQECFILKLNELLLPNAKESAQKGCQVSQFQNEKI
jgi:hypothetical protein